ncbi:MULTISPECIES: diaminopimelate epimerase [Mycobacterium]|uniref:Diaminopimelate epimerase n=2 Tax=Mycobacterium TaxID=1763 RepID=A0A220YAQ4_MYCIT|nr:MULTISPECIES: diaminopimelate epimerase [Mycobacterium]AOS91797.1 diaminopimelate epimerase [Mycobacterium intracellulare subsp. chimaera]ARV81893.1 diaminopimelate epimerase [Mycobacterium intracellulare subsp. chimaera]ASL14707.1 diaminopimelate epimerase [Mycobacterium intracellulare subsp. chimaera]ASL20796.1 diaminopimelate epimerase [Mycobacterium intracellulare subsp. chimaera]ASQ85922.1 diaminopimelate epimerase [Mycobacterium intracellulare subsp. chimaera]
MDFAKGHEAQNDFILLRDLPAAIPLDGAALSAVCDRHRGLGADGVLRVTVAGSAREAGVFDELPSGVTTDDWFMDHRHPDGSIAKTCGDGLRLVTHYLWVLGLERRRRFVIGTATGAHIVEAQAVDGTAADVIVEMRRATVRGTGRAIVADRRLGGLLIDVGEPHLVCVDPDLAEAGWIDVDNDHPKVDVELYGTAQDVTVDLVTTPTEGAVRMWAFRGGEPAQCVSASGAMAVGLATLNHGAADTGTTTVRTPEDDVVVTVSDAAVHVQGRSVIMAHGRLPDAWWRAQSA